MFKILQKSKLLGIKKPPRKPSRSTVWQDTSICNHISTPVIYWRNDYIMKRRRKSNLLFNSYCNFLHIHFKKQIDVIDMVSACSSSPWETASPPQPSVLGFGETSDPHLFNETISILWPKGLFRVGIGPKHRQLEAILGLKPRLSNVNDLFPLSLPHWETINLERLMAISATSWGKLCWMVPRGLCWEPKAFVPRASLTPTNTNRKLLIKLAWQPRNAKEVTPPGAASTSGGRSQR